MMESADKNVHDIAACFNTTTLTQPNISHIIVTSVMQLATFARKLATFKQPAHKGKVLRAPEIAGYLGSTEMSMMTIHSMTS